MMEPLVDFVHVVLKPEDHLDARQIDPEVSLECDDRPDPAHLAWLVSFQRLTPGDADEPESLVTDQRLGGDR